MGKCPNPNCKHELGDHYPIHHLETMPSWKCRICSCEVSDMLLWAAGVR
jgi:hypothetical protein